jgi:DNA-binding MarR family transcriptional regulator
MAARRAKAAVLSDQFGPEELRPVVSAIQHFLIATTRRSMDMWLQLDLTMPQFAALQVIWRQGPLSGRQLADHLGVSQPAVVKVCDRLEARDLIERVRDNLDRRVQWLQLTAAGRAALRKFVTLRREDLGPALKRLSPQDKATLTRVLDELADSIENSGLARRAG